MCFELGGEAEVSFEDVGDGEEDCEEGCGDWVWFSSCMRTACLFVGWGGREQNDVVLGGMQRIAEWGPLFA